MGTSVILQSRSVKKVQRKRGETRQGVSITSIQVELVDPKIPSCSLSNRVHRFNNNTTTVQCDFRRIKAQYMLLLHRELFVTLLKVNDNKHSNK